MSPLAYRWLMLRQEVVFFMFPFGLEAFGILIFCVEFALGWGARELFCAAVAAGWFA